MFFLKIILCEISMYINCLYGVLFFYWVSFYNYMICKCVGVIGYEFEEFIVKLLGIININKF